MTAKKYFIRLSVLALLSAVHIALYLTLFYPHPTIICYVGGFLMLLNAAMLLRYFTLTIRWVVLYRLEKKHLKDPYLYANIFIGVGVIAVLIFLCFIVLFNFIVTLSGMA